MKYHDAIIVNELEIHVPISINRKKIMLSRKMLSNRYIEYDSTYLEIIQACHNLYVVTVQNETRKKTL